MTNAIIYDAEYRAEIFKRIEEQRHQTALLCVNLGIYKDTYEAKQGVRGKNTLVICGYRENDPEFKLQIQTFVIQIVNLIIS